jgi:hypothetical protein
MRGHNTADTSRRFQLFVKDRVLHAFLWLLRLRPGLWVGPMSFHGIFFDKERELMCFLEAGTDRQ